MNSVWSETIRMPEFPVLQGRHKTDVLIIGGGMAGLLCAHQLAQAGVDYLLVEANRIAGGITANTTAKVTAQHGLCYAKLVARFGLERARQYWQANEAARAGMEALCKRIPCDWQQKTSFVYSRSARAKLERELRALEKIGAPARFYERLPLPFRTVGAVAMPKQAQFHPLRFLSAICGGLKLYEHSAVRELSGHTAKTDQGCITAKKIIIATHFPFLNTHGSYFLKLYQHRSYVLALEHARDVKGMYVDEAQDGFSFRNYGGLLLLGGGGHRTGKQGGGWNALSVFAQQYEPGAQEVCRWATQDCMTLDAVPYIGHYSARTPDWFVATGFQKWGMTSSMVAAMLLTDLVQEKPNPYAALFSPSRSILRPQLAVNALEATANLLCVSKRRCPHLGCALKWNRQEHSWDCPCHGSRFAKDGKLLDNPATGDWHPPGA